MLQLIVDVALKFCEEKNHHIFLAVHLRYKATEKRNGLSDILLLLLVELLNYSNWD